MRGGVMGVRLTHQQEGSWSKRETRADACFLTPDS